MSKENALRFMIAKDKDKTIKNEMNVIMDTYERENLSEDEWDRVLKEEIMPLAQKHGFDFSLEDFKQLQKPTEGKLSDEELDKVTGGRGEITLSFRNKYRHIISYHAYCDYAPDDQTFRMRYDQHPTDCPNFVPYGDYDRICMRCENCRLII